MPRPPRRRRPGCSAHVTVRCNNRAFDLRRKEPRLFVLHALARAAEKFGARIYAVAVMSNHVHYLIEPRRPDELPRVMHWLNWYTAMGLNRLLDEGCLYQSAAEGRALSASERALVHSTHRRRELPSFDF